MPYKLNLQSDIHHHLSRTLVHTEDCPRSQFLLSRAEETVRVSESRAWYRVYSGVYCVMQRTENHPDTGPVEIIYPGETPLIFQYNVG